MGWAGIMRCWALFDKPPGRQGTCWDGLGDNLGFTWAGAGEVNYETYRRWTQNKLPGRLQPLGEQNTGSAPEVNTENTC
jgi:hypothetical protein